MTPEDRRKLNQVHTFMLDMQRQDRMPLNAEKAMRYRLKIRDIPLVEVSEKSLNSEDVPVVNSVDFGLLETTTTPVLNDPDAWLKVTIRGVTYHLPAYT